MTVAIKYEHISMAYGDVEVIKDFNLEINKGEFVTIVGASGSGKTTIMKMVNGLITPTSGTIYVDGTDIKSTDIVELRRSIGYVIQGSVLFPNMTVEENISYVPKLLNKRDKEKTKKAVNKWIDIVGLNRDKLKRYPDELSGGQQQRVGIARALAASPDILLMDEPFGAVDSITRASLQSEIIRIYKQTGITVMFVTHNIHEALKLGTKVLVIDNGEVQQFATPDEIAAHPATQYVIDLMKTGN